MKFRAWDKKEKRMFSVWRLTFSGVNHPEVEELVNRPHPRFKLEEAILKHHQSDIVIMQYTGLKDMKQKEIYEGDIVRVVFRKCDEFHPEECAEYVYIAIVRFDEDSFSFVLDIPRNTTLDYRKLTTADEVEVIGNIYENPKLIKRIEN